MVELPKYTVLVSKCKEGRFSRYNKRTWHYGYPWVVQVGLYLTANEYFVMTDSIIMEYVTNTFKPNRYLPNSDDFIGTLYFKKESDVSMLVMYFEGKYVDWTKVTK